MTCTRACRFWSGWTLSSGVGVAIGLLVGAIVGIVIVSPIYAVSIGLRWSAVGLMLGSLLGGAAGGAAAGAILAALQSRVLAWSPRERRTWVRRSAIGWTLGTAMAAFCMLFLTGQRTFAWWPSTLPIDLAHGLVVGILTGLSAGVAQWPVLRGRVTRASRWILGSTLASAIAWALVFGSGILSILGIALGALAYGAFSGAVMTCLLREGSVGPKGGAAEVVPGAV